MFGNHNIFYKLSSDPTKNVAWVFKHHTWKLFLKDFYLHLYQLLISKTGGQKMTKMIHTCRFITIFHYETTWCLIKLQRNILREYHTIISVHNWNKMWSIDAYVQNVACTLGPSKQKCFTRLVTESLKVVVKAKWSVCDHCEMQIVGNERCCVW